MAVQQSKGENDMNNYTTYTAAEKIAVAYIAAEFEMDTDEAAFFYENAVKRDRHYGSEGWLPKRAAQIQFFHFKGEQNTHIRRPAERESLKQIRNDMWGNNAVLDAIYDTKTKKMTVYNKRAGYTEQDYWCNLLPEIADC